MEQRLSVHSEESLMRRLHTEQQKKQSIVYLISFMFFVYIGQEVAYGGWISSYTVLTGISTKE
jgi:fucose permease